MIELLKILAVSEHFGKICLKTIREIPFFQCVVCDQGRDRWDMNEKEGLNFWWWETKVGEASVKRGDF